MVIFNLQEINEYLLRCLQNKINCLNHDWLIKGLCLFLLSQKERKELIWSSSTFLIKVIVEITIKVIISIVICIILVIFFIRISLGLVKQFLLHPFIFLSHLFFHFPLLILLSVLFCLMTSFAPFFNPIIKLIS
jgi:hypothetical protein